MGQDDQDRKEVGYIFATSQKTRVLWTAGMHVLFAI